MDLTGISTASKKIRVKVPSVKSPLTKAPSCLLLQNHSNFTRSDAPSRVMYYDESGSWINFDADVVASFRAAFSERRSVMEATVNNVRYLFDFMRMLQIDFLSGKQRSISWIDVHGRCFFPKSFIGDDFTKLKSNVNEIEIEIEVRVNGTSNSDKRKRVEVELHDEEDRVQQSDEFVSKKQRLTIVPVSNDENNLNWSSAKEEDRVHEMKLDDDDERVEQKQRQTIVPVSNDETNIIWPCAKLVEDDRVHEVVTKLFLSGVKKVIDPNAKISSIHQCTRTGPMERARWEVFRKQIEVTKAVRGNANTTFAWYGTSKKGVESVLLHGFEIPSNGSGSENYGVGIYLSPVSLPHLSAMQSEVDENGEKHVILCRVVLGNVGKVEAGFRQSHPCGWNFDTGVDDLKNPTKYVVWYANMNNHIIPECVVSFKSSDNMPGCLGESTFPKWIPNVRNPLVIKLFSKLASSLPSEKVQKLKVLCSAYKSGKMAKDLFITQLRTLSGDKMLLSIIRDTRGLRDRYLVLELRATEFH